MDAKYAEQLDRGDDLAKYRSEFYLPQGIYLDGNSLGPMSKPAEKSLHQIVNQWQQQGIMGWTNNDNPWFTLAERLGGKMAPLVGAQANEVIITNSTTINLHQILATYYRPTKARNKILTDTLEFPSDLYAIQSHLRLRGYNSETALLMVPSQDGYTINENDFISAMTTDVAMVIVSAVTYQSGQLLDIPLLTQEAHKRGILIVVDCCHSAGIIPHEFDSWDVDLAFWCTYKYLNGGPGSPAAIYVNQKHFGKTPGLAGWFSSEKERQFDMASSLSPAPNAGAMQTGTPPILSMAPLLGSLEMISEVGIPQLQEKSLRLTNYLIKLVDDYLEQYGFTIATPREVNRRGGHVALVHPEAMRISLALRERGVIPDYRPPNIIRLAPCPLYSTFVECYRTVQTLKAIMNTRGYEKFSLEREIVS